MRVAEIADFKGRFVRGRELVFDRAKDACDNVIHVHAYPSRHSLAPGWMR
jgi:hypothetical protein